MLFSIFFKEFKGEFKRLLSPKRFFYVVIFPIMIFGFITFTLHKGVATELPVAIIDSDNTALSQSLTRSLEATPSMRLSSSVSNLTEAQHLMQLQKVYACIEIPSNFQRDVYMGKSPKVACYINNQFMLPAGIISRDFQSVIGTFSAGIRLKKLTQMGEQPAKALREIQPIRIDDHALFNPYTNNSFYLLPAMLPMMYQMIIIMVTIYVIGIEFRYNRGLQWLRNNGGNPSLALVSKLLPYTIALICVGIFMLWLLFGFGNIPLQTSWAKLCFMLLLLIIPYQLMGITLSCLLPNFRLALTLGSGFTALAFSFAAYTFPIEGLPKSIILAANIFPYTHFMKFFVNEAIKGYPTMYSTGAIAGIGIFILIFLISYPLFVKRIKKGGYDDV